MTSDLKLPKWVETRYNALWKVFGDKSFSLDDASQVLHDAFQDGEKEVPVFISEMRKAGWVESDLDPKDARRRTYRLKSMAALIGEQLSMPQAKLTRSDIDSLLKKAADLIRTRVDYKFILVLLFMKRISDKWEAEYEKAYKDALKDGFTEADARKEAKSPSYHQFDLPEEYQWESIRKDVANLPERFSKALKTLAEQNPDLKDILDNVDFVQFTSNRENGEMLRQLVELFSEQKLHHVAPDILGDAYEWILRYFAPDKAKEGEIYTPREVIDLLVEILDPKPQESVYDPACGSAGMLIAAYNYVKGKYGPKEARRLFLYGQEVNQKTIALAKMNMYIHDITDHHLEFGDTFLYPKFKEADGVTQFNVVIANPPWNQDGYGEDTLKKAEFWQKRFSYGFTPQQSADLLWIQHMLASAKEKTGRVGVVIDNGALFRGGKEKAIRQKMLAEGLIECVILLPEKLFYNTGAPGAIMILSKNRSAGQKDKVLFINASTEFEKHPEVRKLNRLGEKNIEKIVKACHTFDEEAGFSRAVSIKELEEQDFSLNVTLYVSPEEEHEEIDVGREWEELLALEGELRATEEKIEGHLKELR